MRKDFIDNLRTLCILLLFPFHTFMIYNNWGEAFYIHGESVAGVSYFNALSYPWWMTLLFTLAGISSFYALKNRTCRQYARERISKLLLPLLTGILFVVPVQSYLADKFHNDYHGDYLRHYPVFFTKFTDLSGYDGGFTPAHLWFLLYLFLVSMIMLPVMGWYKKKSVKLDENKITVLKLLPYFLVILLVTPVIEVGGKSIGESLACFAAGFFVLSLERVQESLKKKAVSLTLLFVIVLVVRFLLMKLCGGQGLFFDIEQRMVTWFGILAILGLGQKFLNFHNPITKYMAGASFPLYYFHQTFLVIVGFYTLRYVKNICLQIAIIISGTFLLSLFTYEIFRRIKITSVLFGIKYTNQ